MSFNHPPPCIKYPAGLLNSPSVSLVHVWQFGISSPSPGIKLCSQSSASRWLFWMVGFRRRIKLWKHQRACCVSFYPEIILQGGIGISCWQMAQCDGKLHLWFLFSWRGWCVQGRMVVEGLLLHQLIIVPRLFSSHVSAGSPSNSSLVFSCFFLVLPSHCTLALLPTEVTWSHNSMC